METLEQKTITNKLSQYFEMLVPSSGPADTVEGEHVRAIMKILYRYHNDGDFFFQGYGAETAGPAAKYLMSSTMPELRKAVIKTSGLYPEEGINQYTEKDPYQNELFNIANIILDYVDSKNGTYEKNTDDMLSKKYYDLAMQSWQDIEEPEEEWYEE